MASLKRLNGACHDLAHHAQSSMSFLHPHLAEECRRAGLAAVTVDLTAEQPYPTELVLSPSMMSALVALKNWFFDLLQRLGVNRSEVSSVKLRFEFRPSREADYDTTVSCTVVTRTGREFVHRLPSMAEMYPDRSVTMTRLRNGRGSRIHSRLRLGGAILLAACLVSYLLVQLSSPQLERVATWWRRIFQGLVVLALAIEVVRFIQRRRK